MKIKNIISIEIRNPYLDNKGNRVIAGVKYSSGKNTLGFDYNYLKRADPITVSEKIVHELIHIKNKKKKWNERKVVKETNRFIHLLYVKDRKAPGTRIMGKHKTEK